MGKVTGFLEIDRQDRQYAPAGDRMRHWKEFVIPLSEEATRDQAARCMNCGIPYCHTGCPVNNQIPDWNDLVYRNDWQEAIAQPAFDQQLPGVHRPRLPGAMRGVVHAQPRRDAGHHQDDRMHDRRPGVGEGLDQARARRPRSPARRSRWSAQGRPASPARSSSARAGHDVHVYEKFAKAGGLLRYGIPDFKMEKHLVVRRIAADGSRGRDVPLQRPCGRQRAGRRSSLDEYDAIALAGGAEKARDLPIPGRDLAGIHFAMDFLPQQNRRVAQRAARRRAADPRGRQARRRHRRRRHRLGLHRHLDAPGRAVGDASSRSCRGRPRRRTSSSPGRTGR